MEGSAFAFNFDYVCGLRATISIDDLEGDSLPLLQGTEAVTLNACEMDEHIIAIVAFDEAITFFRVEPFNRSKLHERSPYSMIAYGRQLHSDWVQYTVNCRNRQ